MASLVPTTKATDILDRLLAWYDGARRDLPWRAPPGTTADPYAVLVSEIMLQQTTVATIQGRYDAFLHRFPTLEALAAAPLEDVLHAWQGLGYYRRARALHACAQALASGGDGRWPRRAAELEKLPGLGRYTAAAIAAIAFDEPVLAVDGNVERVLARLFGVTTPLPRARPELGRLAEALRPRTRPGDTVQAMIELGALLCRPRAPACLGCPVQTLCVAHREGIADQLPQKTPKPARPERFAVAFHLCRPDGAIAFRRRPPTGLLAGMMELPSTAWTAERPIATAVTAAAPVAASWHPVGGVVRHVFSHFALTVEVVRAQQQADIPGVVWCRPGQFASLALPTLTRKLLAHAGS
jgi:A/G-specific adenine glycosylase